MTELKPIKLATVRQSVGKIRRLKADPESAHSEQDRLYLAVLKTIAEGVENPAELAREAIKAEKINFPRWMA